MIHAPHRGRGVLQQCHTAGLRRVWAGIRPHNIASRHIVTRLGMRLGRTDNDERGELLFYVIDLHAADPLG
jgi:RimJ/RimL family protein N-acetyltransferase